jgi:hypothetical protein
MLHLEDLAKGEGLVFVHWSGLTALKEESTLGEPARF